MEQTLFESIYQKVLNTIVTSTIQPEDLVDITTTSMMIVQKYPSLSGNDKKLMVTEVITKIIRQSGLVPEVHQDKAEMFLEVVLPRMIDAVVAAYHGQIDLKKAKFLCPCFGSKTK